MDHCDSDLLVLLGLYRLNPNFHVVCECCSWLITWLMQLHPLVGPQLGNMTILAMQKEWATTPLIARSHHTFTQFSMVISLKFVHCRC